MLQSDDDMPCVHCTRASSVIPFAPNNCTFVHALPFFQIVGQDAWARSLPENSVICLFLENSPSVFDSVATTDQLSPSSPTTSTTTTTSDNKDPLFPIVNYSKAVELTEFFIDRATPWAATEAEFTAKLATYLAQSLVCPKVTARLYKFRHVLEEIESCTWQVTKEFSPFTPTSFSSGDSLHHLPDDVLSCQGLKVMALTGLRDWERQQKQLLEVDFALKVLQPLSHSLNLQFLITELKKFLDSSTFHTSEALTMAALKMLQESVSFLSFGDSKEELVDVYLSINKLYGVPHSLHGVGCSLNSDALSMHHSQQQQQQQQYQAFICLGSNHPNAAELMQKAIMLLSSDIDTKVKVINSSFLYKTKAIGPSPRDYLNAVCQLYCRGLERDVLISALKKIETKLGRDKSLKTLVHMDLDLLFLINTSLGRGCAMRGEIILEVVRPGFESLEYVLRPLCDIASGFIHPTRKKSMQTLLMELADSVTIWNSERVIPAGKGEEDLYWRKSRRSFISSEIDHSETLAKVQISLSLGQDNQLLSISKEKGDFECFLIPISLKQLIYAPWRDLSVRLDSWIKESNLPRWKYIWVFCFKEESEEILRLKPEQLDEFYRNFIQSVFPASPSLPRLYYYGTAIWDLRRFPKNEQVEQLRREISSRLSIAEFITFSELGIDDG